MDQDFSMLDDNQENRKYPQYILGEAFINAPKNIKNRIFQWICDSKDFDEYKYKNKVALIWIDGGHSFEMCLNDWLKSLQMIKFGIRIFCDDVSKIWPGVPQCIHFIQRYLNWNSTKQVITGKFRVSRAYAWFTRTSWITLLIEFCLYMLYLVYLYVNRDFRLHEFSLVFGHSIPNPFRVVFLSNTKNTTQHSSKTNIQI